MGARLSLTYHYTVTDHFRPNPGFPGTPVAHANIWLPRPVDIDDCQSGDILIEHIRMQLPLSVIVMRQHLTASAECIQH